MNLKPNQILRTSSYIYYMESRFFSSYPKSLPYYKNIMYPFKINLWILLIVCLAISTVIMSLHYNEAGIRMRWNLDSFLAIFCMLIEEKITIHWNSLGRFQKKFVVLVDLGFISPNVCLQRKPSYQFGGGQYWEIH